ncbi:YceI family protein [Pararhodonellum marinum]|uniref:YceI family protein n=1 Tax=Pararhodonellum marinum TaxID=2755358 RepID=UPI001E4FF876|nr:YceI family protein [Pararhodonellum marinum]
MNKVYERSTRVLGYLLDSVCPSSQRFEKMFSRKNNLTWSLRQRRSLFSCRLLSLFSCFHFLLLRVKGRICWDISTFTKLKFNKKYHLLFKVLPWFFLFPILLSAQSYKPDQPIQFKIKNAGITVDGIISDWDLEVHFDPKKLNQSSIKGTANPGSIDTGIKLRDKHLLGRQYFHLDKFPLVHLTSKSFKTNGKNAFVGIFELRIKDVKKEVEIPFTLVQSGKQRKFKGEFVIDRLDFGLGEKSLVLSDEVRVVVGF